jgi:hypothetical protein
MTKCANGHRFKSRVIDQCADCGIFGAQLIGERVRELGAWVQDEQENQPTITRGEDGRLGTSEKP